MVVVSKPSRLSRRDLFKALMAGVGASAFGAPALARAAAPEVRDIGVIFAYFRGGWDLLLGLDPRDPRRFHDGNAESTGIRPGYHLISAANPNGPLRTRSGLMLGPCAAPMARHEDRLTVIRGLQMETLVHQAALYRFVTGRRWWGGHASRPPLASMLSAQLATTHLSIGIEQDGAVAGPEGEIGDRTAAAVQAVTSGSNRVVTLEVASGLDTHGAEWRSQHFKRLKRGFAAVAEMADRLATARAPSGAGWLDQTLIFGFSELGRSPLLNAQGGRDHHLANACFLLGGPAVGCRTLGATSDRGMEALPVNLADGRPDPSGRLLRPEHVLQALLQATGSPANLGVPPLKWAWRRP